MAVSERVETILSSLGVPFAYRQFTPYKNKPVPDPPYAVYLIDNESAFGADKKNLGVKRQVTVELYTNSKDAALEKKTEKALERFSYSKYEDYLDTESMYMISYEFDLYEKTGGNNSGK